MRHTTIPDIFTCNIIITIARRRIIVYRKEITITLTSHHYPRIDQGDIEGRK